MATAHFYNVNSYRDYPFINPAYLPGGQPSIGAHQLLPQSAVVDFGAVLGLDADYRDGLDTVYLAQLTRSGDQFTFEFRTSASGAADSPLRFTRQLTDLAYTLEDTVAHSASAAADDVGACSHEPAWEGFLVTGDLSPLTEFLPTDGSISFGPDWQIEPGRMQNLARRYVRSLNLANVDRTRVTPPAACGGVIPDTSPVLVNAVCLQGDIKFKSGFNTVIRQDATANALLISAALGAGAGQACDEVALHPGETAPAGSHLLTGGPSCTQILKTINGVGGSVIRLIAGAGFAIGPHPTLPNTVLIDANLQELGACLTTPAALPLSESSLSFGA